MITVLDEITVCKDGTLSRSEVAVNSEYVVRARETSMNLTAGQTVRFAHIVTELTLDDGTVLRIAGTLPAVVARLNGTSGSSTRQPLAATGSGE